jgi:polygalacturonase
MVTIRFALMLAAAAPFLSAQSPAPFNVRNYGATGDGVTLDTRAINSAIGACGKSGGGTVYFPAGTYLSGTVRLQDNVTLWLDSGATLRGTRNLAEYESAVPGQSWYQALVLAKGVSNIAIAGRGIIDGNKVRNPKGEERMRGPHAVLLYQVRDASVRDISIWDAGNYALILRSAERINVDGITVQGGWDGINMHDTRDATIANCRIYTGDDSLAGAHWENVTVSNCILNSSANAIRAGGRNVLFTNLLIYGPGKHPAGTSQRHRLEAGFQILPHRDRSPNGGEGQVVAPGPIDNMVISNVTMVNTGTPIYIAYSSDASYSANNLGVGRITFNNIIATGAGLVPIYISAPPGNPAKAIVLNNVRVSTRGGADETQSQGQGFSPFSILQAYGVYGRNVQRLELHDVRFEYEAEDRRPAIFVDGVGTLELDRFLAMRTPGGAPSIELSQSGKVVMDGKPAPAAEARVLDLRLPRASVPTGEPYRASVVVQNTGAGGFADVPLEIGGERLLRRVWLDAEEKSEVWFLNVRAKNVGEVRLQAGAVTKTLVVTGAESKPVAAPYRFFKNVESEARQLPNGFYLRAAGDYPLQQYGDQYASIYQPQSLPQRGTVVVKVENPDLRTNWVGRAGIIVRNDVSKPDQPGGYVILATSPAAGPSLEWDADVNGRIDGHTPFDGYTVWPHWLKLQRDGKRFTGYSSIDGATWTKVGEAEVTGATEMLDAGMFTYRDSARFENFKIEK